MALEVVGSRPTIHPLSFIKMRWGVAKRLRHGALTPAFAGSIPATPGLDSLAQSVEHLTFNQGAWGSNPQWVTILDGTCGCGGMADAADLGSVARGV